LAFRRSFEKCFSEFVKSMYKTTRICKQCGKAFTPEAGRQIFCCAACREKYKKRTRQLKKEAQNHALSLEDTRAALDNKTHLSISEAAAYLGISRPTVYARIKEGELVPVRFATKTLRIPIEQLRIDTAKLPQASKGDFSILISKEDAIARYEITSAWLYRKCRSEGIRPKIIKGKAFFPKKDLDRMFPPKVTYNPDDWYNADDLIKDEGFTRKYITNFIRIKKIPCCRKGKTLLVSRREWDNARIARGDLRENYITVDQARKRYHIGQKTFYDGIRENGIQGIRQGGYVYFSISELNRLFKDKTPKIPAEIRRNYIRRNDAIEHYHVGTKRFTAETEAAGVTKIRTEGNFVWYKKSELDELFK
jgi:excisionase family DNA binding protein